MQATCTIPAYLPLVLLHPAYQSMIGQILPTNCTTNRPQGRFQVYEPGSEPPPMSPSNGSTMVVVPLAAIAPAILDTQQEGGQMPVIVPGALPGPLAEQPLVHLRWVRVRVCVSVCVCASVCVCVCVRVCASLQLIKIRPCPKSGTARPPPQGSQCCLSKQGQVQAQFLYLLLMTRSAPID